MVALKGVEPLCLATDAFETPVYTVPPQGYKWCPWKDSNLHFEGLKSSASTHWATGAYLQTNLTSGTEANFALS